MKNFFKYLLFCVIIAQVFTTCKRYKENDRFPIRSVDYRIRGAYHIRMYKVNDIDSTGYLLQPSLPIYFIHEHHTYSGQVDSYNMGEWTLSKDKRWINIRAENYNKGGTGNITPLNTTLLFASPETAIGWRILKLTNMEFWIETNFNGSAYELHFEKIEQF